MFIDVKAGHHRRIWCPVSVELPEGVETGALVDASSGMTVPAQAWQRDGRRMLSWIVPYLDAGSRTHYYPVPNAGVQEHPGVRIVDNGCDELSIFLGDEVFTKYRYGPGVVRPYLYPVYAAPGAGITRNWPMVQDVDGETDDHPHHKGIYTAQGDVNGVDNWGEVDGRQIHKEFIRMFDGPVDAGFVESLEWTDVQGKPNMSETRFMRFMASSPGIRIIDYSVTLHASHGRVVLGDTKEGGLLSIRVATTMDAARSDGGRITNAYGGIQENETWGKPSPWCDYSGPVDGTWYGVCMMDHPDNPRHPTPWHVREYGLMTANCFGYHDFTGDPDNLHDFPIEDGESVTWQYRLVIHRGSAADSQVSEHYFNFASPPEITVAGLS